MAYINKALSWPAIRPDDGEALAFLASCNNAVTEIEFMEEMNVWPTLKP